eukprot:7228909-Prymnesium_polylepis.2
MAPPTTARARLAARRAHMRETERQRERARERENMRAVHADASYDDWAADAIVSRMCHIERRDTFCTDDRPKSVPIYLVPGYVLPCMYTFTYA